jgi:hypothetical protein
MSGGIRGSLCRALGAVGVGAGLLVPTAGAVAPHPPCGSTVTTDVTLHGDMNCPGVDALIVGASGITINLNGFEITNHGTPFTQTGILVAGHHGITVKEGTVSNFAMGVDFEQTRDDTIKDVIAKHNAFGIDLARDTDVTVTESVARHNLIDGVALFSDNMVRLTRSDFSANATTSPQFGCPAGDHSCAGLFATRTLDTINGDRFDGNGGFGLLVDHPRTGTSSSGTRLVFTIANSIADKNRLAGFSVHHNSPTDNQATLVNNDAAFNGTFGFWALEPVEGGVNRAHDNTSGECHNVPCVSASAPTP